MALIAVRNQRVCWLSFHDSIASKSKGFRGLKAQFETEAVKIDSRGIRVLAERIFCVDKKLGKVKLDFFGTVFQKAVWRALQKIPFGKTCSYEQVAKQIKRPEAVRAVASAIASNSIAYLVPCHRVIRKSGKTNDYRWGSARKQAILDWERQSRLKRSG